MAGLLPGATSPPSSPYPPPRVPLPNSRRRRRRCCRSTWLSLLCFHPEENLPLRSRGGSVFLYPGRFPSCGRGAEIISDECERVMLLRWFYVLWVSAGRWWGGAGGAGVDFLSCAEKRKQSGFNLVSGGRVGRSGRRWAENGQTSSELKRNSDIRVFFFPRRVLDMMAPSPNSRLGPCICIVDSRLV